MISYLINLIVLTAGRWRSRAITVSYRSCATKTKQFWIVNTSLVLTELCTIVCGRRNSKAIYVFIWLVTRPARAEPTYKMYCITILYYILCRYIIHRQRTIGMFDTISIDHCLVYSTRLNI